MSMNLKPIAAAVCAMSVAVTPVFANGSDAPAGSGAVAVPPMNAVDQVNSIRQQGGDRSVLQDRAAQARELDSILANNNGVLMDQDPGLGNDWFERIKLGAAVNFDARFGTRHVDSAGSHFDDGYSSGFALKDVLIYLDAQVNDWTKAHITLAAVDGDEDTWGGPDLARENLQSSYLDEAWITIGDLNKFPLFMTVGRMYVDFGNYEAFELTSKLTTNLSQMQGSVAKIGYEQDLANNGRIYAGGYILDGDPNRESNGNVHPNRLQNGGAYAGYMMTQGMFSMDAGVSYLWNMADVNLISNTTGGSYRDNVQAGTAHAYFDYGPFSLYLNGVAALEDFHASDVAWKSGGAQPWAVGAEAGYQFPVMNHDTRVFASAQFADEALALGLPEQQYILGYSINLFKLTDLELQGVYNQDYSKGDGGTDDGDWEAAARLSIRV